MVFGIGLRGYLKNKMRDWYSGSTRPSQGLDTGSIPVSRTRTELKGFERAKMRACRRHAHWFSPDFANEFLKFGALARNVFSPRRRLEPKISLAQAFLAKKSESEAILSKFCATFNQF